MRNDSSCCAGGCGCSCNDSGCAPKENKQEGQKENKKVVIDFLFLDLSICQRCQGTESSLLDALGEVSSVLKAAGYEVVLNKVHIETEELAKQYEFVSSPTIRVNGRDIALTVKESCCEDCGDLCGDTVDCRVWEYDGKEYTVPPKAMIVNAILKEVYGGAQAQTKKAAYEVPENLKNFFAKKK